MAKAWMVRAGEGGRLVNDFVKHKVVAVGWSRLPDLSAVNSRDALRKLINEKYSEDKPGQRQSWMSQMGTFRFDIQPGDEVVTYDPDARRYHLGIVAGKYQHVLGKVPEYAHVHTVQWNGSANRDDLSVPARNTLGAIQTVFSVNDVIDELKALAEGKKQPSTTSTETQRDELEELRQDVISRSHEFVKDRIQQLAWDDLQDLVAGLLRAMGYQTRVSPPGADRGRDIEASPDGLGLEQPRIRVEVKHRLKEVVGAPTVRSFIGALRSGDRGVFVSTGGYTKEARYEAERAQNPVTLLDSDDLVALLTQHYEKTDTETRTLVPLIRLYWPAS